MGSLRGVRRLAKIVVAACLVTAGLTTMSQGASRSIDLRKTPPAVTMTGAYKVARVGDVNGDGIPDLLVSKGQHGADPSAGIVYVVFNTRRRREVDLREVGTQGFVIRGTKPNDGASFAAGAGDVNGDGLDDIVVGAPGADNNGRLDSGSAYVVFGKKDFLPVHLAEFDANAQGIQGFRIDGPSSRSIAGRYTAGAGDVNGDGLDDVLVGAPFRGASYVVFGKAIPTPVDLLTFDLGLQGDAGYVIETPSPGWDDYYSLAGAGDVNGDGTPDVAVGVKNRNPSTMGLYIVFGKQDSEPVDVLKSRRYGFRIKADHRESVVGIGDVNRDGRDDVAMWSYPDVYVVFGKKSLGTINLDHLGKRGYLIKGPQYGYAGISMDRLGDLNSDRRPDLVFGAPFMGHNRRKESGSVFVVFGKGNSKPLNMLNLGGHGYRIDGAQTHNFLGTSVAGPGDVNGDGVPDVAAGIEGLGDGPDGLPYDDPSDAPGQAVIVWGRP
ncbi:MAG: VCBS repeat-containing protein [Actinomycetota bacterium]|nr:VCBS repeat-containing protein [Actinomycetota bacterium]